MKKKLWITVTACVLAAVLITGCVLLFGVYLPKQREKRKWLEQVAAYRAAKIAQYERENAEYGDYEVEVAFLGDSLTDGYDVKAYYPQYLTVNRGIGGDTTFDLEGRLQTSVYDLKPQVATLLIGANNFATMLDNYERICDISVERMLTISSYIQKEMVFGLQGQPSDLKMIPSFVDSVCTGGKIITS